MKKNLLSLILILFCSKLIGQDLIYTAPLGVQTYSFREIFKEDPVKAFDLIKEMGFEEVEGYGTSLTPQEFKNLANERNLRIPSFGASFEDLENNLAMLIEQAKILDAEYIMCAWIPHGKKFTINDAEKAVNTFNKAGKILAENGITLTYHPHGYEFWPYYNLTLLDYLILKTDPKYVSFEMDTFWVFFGGGDPVGLLKRYPTRWKLMHLKDMRIGTKKDLSGSTSTENDVALGTGELNLKAILKTAKEIGIKHYFIEDESAEILQQIPASVNYLKTLK